MYAPGSSCHSASVSRRVKFTNCSGVGPSTDTRQDRAPRPPLWFSSHSLGTRVTAALSGHVSCKENRGRSFQWLHQDECSRNSSVYTSVCIYVSWPQGSCMLLHSGLNTHRVSWMKLVVEKDLYSTLSVFYHTTRLMYQGWHLGCTHAGNQTTSQSLSVYHLALQMKLIVVVI